MTYSQLRLCDAGEVSELHERCARMLVREFDPLLQWSWRNSPHGQKAWDLYRMCRGLRRRGECIQPGFFRLEFSSLGELDLRLAAMGY